MCMLNLIRTMVCRCRFYSPVLSLCHSSWSYSRYHLFDIELTFPLCTANLNWYYTFLSLVYQLIKHLISNTTNCVFLTEPVLVPCYALIPLIPWYFWFWVMDVWLHVFSSLFGMICREFSSVSIFIPLPCSFWEESACVNSYGKIACIIIKYYNLSACWVSKMVDNPTEC